jgi:hypothetical protein
MVDVIVLQFTGYGFSLVVFFGPKRPAVNLDQSGNIRIHQFYEIDYLFQIPVGVFKIAAVWHRKVEMPPNPCCVTYVIQKKSHIILTRYLGIL